MTKRGRRSDGHHGSARARTAAGGRRSRSSSRSWAGGNTYRGRRPDPGGVGRERSDSGGVRGTRPSWRTGVLMTVEVTSGASDTGRRARVEKPHAYAEAGIPVFLLIDRKAGEVRVHSQPYGERYERVVAVPFGKSTTLPEVVGMELDTEPLKNWVH
ncbi:Uma2 family endonuclease [Streptomyces sp. NPDC057101]|uniref:Uma2 family endonuclease n=1 Tax=Streptomyces sp. NPDC057101 TaxID=3346020 RepID=UPI00362E7086